MSLSTVTFLDTIIAHKRAEVALQKQTQPLDAWRAEAEAAPPPRNFLAALRAPGVSLIAEVKKASPSKGLLCPDFDPVRLARAYAANGAAAISVLTDERFFQGSLDDLRAVREVVDVPVLRKDFVVDAYQVYEARAAGADAVLLIVAALEDERLHALHALIGELGMTALVEVHNAAEVERALALQPRLIGVNNRDLRTFHVTLDTTAALRPRVPEGVILVAESGIHTPEDVTRLAALGVDAMLVGEALVTARDVGEKVRGVPMWQATPTTMKMLAPDHNPALRDGGL
jgi:indole-3-glycerol phosphate synthase